MPLETGKYEPKTTRHVTVWKAPDKDGDGEEVWRDVHDGSGNYVGRERVTDANGAPVHHYSVPEGFRRIHSQGTDQSTVVRVNERGEPVRHPITGHAAIIEPGTALVEHPDGTFDILRDDFSKYLFEQAHTTAEDKEEPE